MKRNFVYEAIDSERDYQEKMTANPERPDMIEDFHIGDTLSAIQYNLDNARREWYRGAVPHTEAIEFLRKIAASAVS